MMMYQALHRDIAIKAWCRICNDDKQKLEEASLVLDIRLDLTTSYSNFRVGFRSLSEPLLKFEQDGVPNTRPIV